MYILTISYRPNPTNNYMVYTITQSDNKVFFKTFTALMKHIEDTLVKQNGNVNFSVEFVEVKD